MTPNVEADVTVIGSGPAGISAAVNCAAMNKKTVIISGSADNSGLSKAERIDNFPGEYGISGPELIKKLYSHAQAMGVPIYNGQVLNIIPANGRFGISFGTEFLMAKAVIIATGVVRCVTFPGEKEYLGRGVSYCAVCDGMLYRGKDVCVFGDSGEALEDAKYLRDLGCGVTYISKEKVYEENITSIKGEKLIIKGGERVEAAILGDTEIKCSGVFILRRSIAPAVMLSGLELEDGHIKVNRSGETNIPGVFAAGDCAGLPYQAAKAVGEGQTAAFSAVKYLKSQNDGKED